MSYYEVLNIHKEPFSTSPDPYFFYRSSAHETAMSRLEIAVRLRRGLSLIIGDVGTGKTTLGRTLLQNFNQEDTFVFHMILDPTYKSEFQFLSSLGKMFGVPPHLKSTLDYRDAIEKYLFHKGVDENKTIILLIDEGQKLTPTFLEILRTLLNYETNEYKLLQLVILAQMEIMPKVKKIKNFFDRITLKYIINPLDEEETKDMIEFRLRQAGYNGPEGFFSDGAVKLIHEHTMGYPRKIAILCHNALEAAVMKDKRIIDEPIILDIIRNEVI
ncbi:MAG: AAA family ATPase [Candidatus Omnitrophica bacterium]|nr:AAA family ATPase [Candidatus Omnitrophota bacterium]MBU4487971.1 AAA family ATPase [Candidatus Omnitrophota bacterium]MCG2705227.1 AAA family ATPase [Candidatus Omnitrophota bacterium]